MPLYVGTSGWDYRDWRGVFYPPKVPARRWLEYYAENYATVENNGTFYRLPSAETFTGWRARLPEGFVMAIKASRYLTHVRRLRDPAQPVARLMTAAAGLGSRLGPVLLQLPPTLTADPDLLDACLAEFAKTHDNAGRPGTANAVRIVVEPRHPSWWDASVQEVLSSHGAALCWADRLGEAVTPLWRPAGWGYLRLHEGTAQPWPRYDAATLRSWVSRIAERWPDGQDVYVYFNNDPGGAAVADSAAFAALATDAGLTATRAPALPGPAV
ncbi:MAG TPA: DUF72 domain-containing protein [Streptosporangiaceae bacterium]|nr:DUF72 domain-containing protein [Streptosporangiaceae bacterium]